MISFHQLSFPECIWISREQMTLGVVTFLLSISCFSVAVINYCDQGTLQKGQFIWVYTSEERERSPSASQQGAWQAADWQQAGPVTGTASWGQPDPQARCREQTKLGSSLLILKAWPQWPTSLSKITPPEPTPSSATNRKLNIQISRLCGHVIETITTVFWGNTLTRPYCCLKNTSPCCDTTMLYEAVRGNVNPTGWE